MLLASNFQWCNPGISWGNIQLGADKRIHMPYSGNTVSTVSKPNRIGSFANYVFNSYQLPYLNSGYIATPRFQHRLLEKAVKNNIIYHGGCYPSPITFSVTNDTIAGFLWNFGDPSSTNNTSTAASPSHSFSTPGIYTVTAQLYNSQSQLIDTISELVEVKDPSKRILYAYPTDTSFCSGNSMTIQLNVVNGIFNWYQLYNGNVYGSLTSDSIRINATGTYYVQMRQNDCDGCIMLDSIHVTVLPVPFINLGPDKNLCSGDSIHLSVSSPPASYIWNTGDTTNSIWVNHGGVYWVQAEFDQNGCPKRDSIVITEVPGVQFSLPNDSTLCNNQTLLLNPGVSNASYLWQNGSTQTTYTVTQPGTYWVRVTSTNGCQHSDTIHVNYINAQQVFLGNDSTLCAGDSLSLHSSVVNAQYLWSTGSTADHITVNQTGTYWIAVNNGNCIVTDTIQVIFHLPPSLSLGNDSTLCANASLVLHGGNPGAIYLWQNGSQADSFVVTQPGIYWLQLQQYGCTVKDSINIAYYVVPVIDLGTDLSFCTGDSAALSAGNGFSQYLWSTGAVSQQIVVTNIGNYSVIGTTIDGCKAYDTIRVLNLFSLPVVQLNHDTTLCTGDSRLLDAGSGFISYLWNDGSSSRTKLVNGIGSYAVTVTNNNGCRGSDTTFIKKLLPLPTNFLPPDTVICSYGTLDIQSAQVYSQYLWSNNSNTRKISVSLPGIYWLKVTDNNYCRGTDTIIINPKDCLKGLYVPSAFTPNKDGRNDLLKPFLFGKIKQFHFTIYDRWGLVVFQTEQPGKGWNGEFGGRPQESNIFIWVCTYQLEGEQPKIEKGSFMLIR